MNFVFMPPHPDPHRDHRHNPSDPNEASDIKLELLQIRQLLATSLDAVDVGLEIWDESDQLVLYNNQDNRLRMGFYVPDDIGKTYDALQSVQHERQMITDEDGLTPTPSMQVQVARPRHGEPPLQELPFDRWVKNYEATTPEGYLLVLRVNVTELIRKGRQLEARNRTLTVQSTTDCLTGLANRRYFDEMLTTEWQRATRTGSDLSLLMVDIDHFKKFNDHYGHLAGDACLRRVAEVLLRCVRRAGELVARYGGEEFVVLLPSTSLAEALETAQKCLRLMCEEGIAHAASPVSGHVTISIGVACLSKGMTRDARAMLNAADAAMYRAKSQGRARCCVADEADWDIEPQTPRTGFAAQE
ncbi:MAG: diguanylate cyclase [Burkholderiales bacterium]